jgi:hypothetical protein
MSIINLLKNDVWSERDIVEAGRAETARHISRERQHDLQTIMLGHVSGLRPATTAQMAEILEVKALSEAQAIEDDAARADMALLQTALDHEAALARLLREPVTEPLTMTVTDVDGGKTEISNPAVAVDLAERKAAQALIDGAGPATLALLALRHPPLPEPVVDLLLEVPAP